MIIKEMENPDYFLVESDDKTVACVMTTRLTSRDVRGWQVEAIRIGVHPETHEEIWVPVRVDKWDTPKIFPSMSAALSNVERTIKNLSIKLYPPTRGG